MDGGGRTESGTEVESNAWSGCRGPLSYRAWKPPKNRAEVQHFCWPRRGIWAHTASKRRLRAISSPDDTRWDRGKGRLSVLYSDNTQEHTMGKAAQRRHAPRRTQAQWCVLLEQYSGSGQPQTAFRSSRGIAISSFTGALRRAREEQVEVDNARTLVSLVLSDTVEEARSLVWDAELTLGAGVVLPIRGA